MSTPSNYSKNLRHPVQHRGGDQQSNGSFGLLLLIAMAIAAVLLAMATGGTLPLN